MDNRFPSVFSIFVVFSGFLFASDIPHMVNYQGKYFDGTVNFDGILNDGILDQSGTLDMNKK